MSLCSPVPSTNKLLIKTNQYLRNLFHFSNQDNVFIKLVSSFNGTPTLSTTHAVQSIWSADGCIMHEIRMLHQLRRKPETHKPLKNYKSFSRGTKNPLFTFIVCRSQSTRTRNSCNICSEFQLGLMHDVLYFLCYIPIPFHAMRSDANLPTCQVHGRFSLLLAFTLRFLS